MKPFSTLPNSFRMKVHSSFSRPVSCGAGTGAGASLGGGGASSKDSSTLGAAAALLRSRLNAEPDGGEGGWAGASAGMRTAGMAARRGNPPTRGTTTPAGLAAG